MTFTLLQYFYFCYRKCVQLDDFLIDLTDTRDNLIQSSFRYKM